MIDIIRGNFKITKCSCGCMFKFQDEDIKHLLKKCWFGKNRYDFIDFVECPKCRNRIFKDKGGWM